VERLRGTETERLAAKGIGKSGSESAKKAVSPSSESLDPNAASTTTDSTLERSPESTKRKGAFLGRTGDRTRARVGGARFQGFRDNASFPCPMPVTPVDPFVRPLLLYHETFEIISFIFHMRMIIQTKNPIRWHIDTLFILRSVIGI
jgi:hypothetical protein